MRLELHTTFTTIIAFAACVQQTANANQTHTTNMNTATKTLLSEHSQIKDLTGQVFGRLTAISFTRRKIIGGQGKSMWMCDCSCGKKIEVYATCLNRGTTKSCGCLKLEALARRSTTHGYAKRGRMRSREYTSWSNMVKRCTNPKSTAFNNYGGRGITVCDDWLEYENFISDMGKCPDGMMIERINNSLGYFKENCKWATPLEQANNTRKNAYVEHEGKIVTIAQLSRMLSMSYDKVKWMTRNSRLPATGTVLTPVVTPPPPAVIPNY